MHWKKYALDSPDFEQYREELKGKTEKNYEAIVRYIRSDKGKECISFEQWRPVARILIVVTSLMGVVFCLIAPMIARIPELFFNIGWIAPLVANYILMKKQGVTLPEWVIQKGRGKRSFTSIKPRIQINDGLLELEY